MRDSKKPKSGRSREYHRRQGNATSPTAARPTAWIRRTFDRAEIQDVIRHRALDFRLDRPIYRKTACPRFLPFTPTNRQQHINFPTPASHSSVARIVHLPDI